MKRLVFAVFLFLTSCGTTYWVHGTKSSADFQPDAMNCTTYANSVAWSSAPPVAPTYRYNPNTGIATPSPDFSGITRSIAINKLQKDCLRNLGWQQVSKKTIATNPPSSSPAINNSMWQDQSFKDIQNTSVITPLTEETPHTYLSGGKYICERSYKQTGDKCVKMFGPPHSYFIGPDWFCEKGYRQKGNACIR